MPPEQEEEKEVPSPAPGPGPQGPRSPWLPEAWPRLTGNTPRAGGGRGGASPAPGPQGSPQWLPEPPAQTDRGPVLPSLPARALQCEPLVECAPPDKYCVITRAGEYPHRPHLLHVGLWAQPRPRGHHVLLQEPSSGAPPRGCRGRDDPSFFVGFMCPCKGWLRETPSAAQQHCHPEIPVPASRFEGVPARREIGV